MPGPPPTRTAAPRWVWATVVGLLAGVLAWFRLSPTTRATLWAEDGHIFLADRLREGPLQSWFDPYMGYLHLVPRALADAVVSFQPVDRYAFGMTALSCAVVGAVALLVVRCSADVVPWLPARIALGLATALLPALPIEVLGNTANLHWVLLWLAPWLLLTTPRSHREGVGLGFVGLVAALTEIQIVWFAPLVLHRHKDRRRWWVAGAVLVGLAVQGVTTLVDPRTRLDHADVGPADIGEGYLVGAVTSAWTGSAEVVGDLVRDHGLLPIAATALPFLVVLAYVLRRGGRDQVLAGAALAVGSAVVWSAAGIANPWAGLTYPDYSDFEWAHLELIRYGVVPALLLVGLVALAAAVLRDRGRRLAPWALLAALTVTAALSFDVPHHTRSDGPRWEDEVDEAEARCAGRARDHVVAVPIAPDGWAVDLRCDALGDPQGP